MKIKQNILKNQWTKEEITRKIRKCFETMKMKTQHTRIYGMPKSRTKREIYNYLKKKKEKKKISNQQSNFKLEKDLTDVAQRIELWPANQRVSSSIPSQDTCLGCGPGPQCTNTRGFSRGNHTLMFLSLSFSLPFPLSKNK